MLLSVTLYRTEKMYVVSKKFKSVAPKRVLIGWQRVATAGDSPRKCGLPLLTEKASF